MRLRRDVPLLAAVLTLAGSSAPAAYGLANRAPIAGGDQPKAARVQDSAAGSDELLAFGVAAGGLALVGAGIASSRRSTRRRSGTVRASSGS